MVDWVTSAASIGGSLISGGMGSKASKSAENAQRRMAADGLAQQNYKLDSATANARNDLQPFLSTGTGANNLLAQLLGIGTPSGVGNAPTRQQFENEVRNEHFQQFGRDYGGGSNMGAVQQEVERRFNEATQKYNQEVEAARAANPGASGSGYLLSNFTNEDFLKDPGYEFRRDEGELGVNRALTSGGRYDSGAALKALTRFNQDYASNEFQNAYNRDAANKDRTFNYLTGTSNAGQQAGTSLANIGMGAASQAGNNINNANNLNSQATQYGLMGAQAQNNAIQGGIGNLLTAYLRGQGNGGSSGNGTYSGAGNTNSSGGISLAGLTSNLGWNY